MERISVECEYLSVRGNVPVADQGNCAVHTVASHGALYGHPVGKDNSGFVRLRVDNHRELEISYIG